MKFAPIIAILCGSALAEYTPSSDKCPAKNSLVPPGGKSEGLLRKNTLLSENEYEWIQERKSNVKSNLVEFLNGLNMSDYGNGYFDNFFNDQSSNHSENVVNIGLSFSGGSFKALLTGAGQFAALDSRTKSDKNASALQGIVDSSTYISALSGGSIMLSSLIYQNWSSVDDILQKGEIWNFTQPPVSTNLSFWTELLGESKQKAKAGYDISLIDLFGIILSRYMFANYANDGADLTWSGIRENDAFKNHKMPFPMILSTGGVNSNMSGFADNVFEMSPYEFGSWSPFVGGFSDIKYLGTSMKEGEPTNKTDCTVDFDNAGFMVACSSDFLALWQKYLPQILTSGNTSALDGLGLGNIDISVTEIRSLMGMVSPDTDDIMYALAPNPFYKSNLPGDKSDLASNDTLKLVDGGLFDEGVPLDPFLVPARQVDVVIAYDNGGDSEDNFPNGTSLLSTKERWEKSFPDDKFYDIPSSAEEFVSKGLNRKPSFFGCNGTGLITDEISGENSDEFNYMKPLLVYIPNTNMTKISNTSQVVFSDEQRALMIKGGYEVATRGNFTEDDEFAQCIGCAILRRTQERRGLKVGDQCSRCFERYCYSEDKEVSGSITENLPTSVYSSATASSGSSTSSSGSGSNGSSTGTGSSGSSSSKAGASNFGYSSFLAGLAGLMMII